MIPATLVMSPIQIILIFGLKGLEQGIRPSRNQRMIWMSGSGMRILAVGPCGYIRIRQQLHNFLAQVRG
jgi:hypothetical protein